MSASNHRVKEYESVHHLISRIAHRVYFLGEDERSEFLDLIFRAAAFCGLEVIGWCIMTNHFHVLVYLPMPEDLSEEELIRRYGVLKGEKAANRFEHEIQRLRRQGESGEAMAAEKFEALRRRMYNVGEYMKIVKQTFTEMYNSRKDHAGTMWEAVYKDKVVPRKTKDLSDVLCYQHLNPIRAAVTSDLTAYEWSSLSAFARGDKRAEKGMRFVYGEGITREEILEVHCRRMYELLEEVKLERAKEIVRKRAVGLCVPTDHLTSEAMVAETAAHLERVQQSFVELKTKCDNSMSREDRRKRGEDMLVMALKEFPKMNARELSNRTGIPTSTIYVYLRSLKAAGRIL